MAIIVLTEKEVIDCGYPPTREQPLAEALTLNDADKAPQFVRLREMLAVPPFEKDVESAVGPVVGVTFVSIVSRLWLTVRKLYEPVPEFEPYKVLFAAEA